MARLTNVTITLIKSDNQPPALSVEVQASVATGMFRHTLTAFALPADQQLRIDQLLTAIRAAVVEHVRGELVLDP